MSVRSPRIAATAEKMPRSRYAIDAGGGHSVLYLRQCEPASASKSTQMRNAGQMKRFPEVSLADTQREVVQRRVNV